MIWSGLSNCVHTEPWLDMLLLAARPPAGAAVSGGQLLLWLLLAGVAVGIVSGALYYGHRWHHRHRHQSHAALFRGLCETHRLDRSARRLLSQVGRYHRLAQPARLFTEPEWLEPAKLGDRFSAKAGEVADLRTRLFAVAAPPAT